MTATVHPFQPNARTHERRRRERQATRQRLLARIGIRHEDAPLYDEQLMFLAHEESLQNSIHGDLIPENRLLEKQIIKNGVDQIYRVFQLSAGWTDPEPPTVEQIEAMEDGVLEL